jgi:phosphoadenosine phosphosulfate reductase
VLAHLIYSDLVHKEYQNIQMFTVDTGRTSDEIYLAMEQLQRRYGDVLKVYHPDGKELEQFDANHRFSDDYSQHNIDIRLARPLKRALKGKKALIANGITPRNGSNGQAWINWDDVHQLPHFNPLARWTREEINSYAKHHGLPLPNILRQQAIAPNVTIGEVTNTGITNNELTSKTRIFPGVAMGR